MLHHVTLEVRAPDVDACLGFWRLLGFAEVAVPGPLLRDGVRWLERDGSQIHLRPVERPVAAPEGHVAVVVEDYEGTLHALRGAGRDPEPRPVLWGSPRAFVRDPAGHRVELMAFPPARSA